MIRLPNQKQRITIVGRTGSGKTVAACWHLSLKPLDKMPWIIYDFKGDELINSIDRAKHVDLDFVPGKKDTGVFIVHPNPSEEEDVEKQMWKLWERENVGVYIDEGYMVARNGAANSLLTQGRSKHIPMIVLAQRPVWLSRFAFSEADFFQVFNLTNKADRITMMGHAPIDLTGGRLADYHSFYYDVGQDKTTLLSPVPPEKIILENIEKKLKSHRKII